MLDMKKRTAFIGKIIFLISLGQPLIFKNVVVLSSAVLTISLPVNVNAETAQFYITRADEKFIKKDYYAAISDYTRAIEIGYPLSYPIRRIGRAKYYMGDFSGALLYFNQAIAKEPRNRFNYQFRGDTKADMGDNYGAISDYNRAIEIDPSDPYSYIFSGYAKLNLDDINAACFDWEIAQRKDAENIFNVDFLLSSYCSN